MNRRLFMASIAAAIATPKQLLAGGGSIDYTPGLVNDRLAAGETVLVDYAASWCGVCKRQERVIEKLRAENPKLDENITFIRVDWDQYGSHEVTRSRKVPRRSTLLLLRGEDELGRIVAGVSTDKIKALLELGLTDA